MQRSRSPSDRASPSRTVSPHTSGKNNSPETPRKRLVSAAQLPLQDDDIVFELNEKNNTWQIVAASLEKLIICIYHPRITDSNLAESFLLSFRTLIPPNDLLAELIHRASASEFDVPKEIYLAQKRILKFILKWIGMHPYDFVGALAKTLRDFISTVPAKEPILHRYGARILKKLTILPEKERSQTRPGRSRSEPTSVPSAMKALEFSVTHVTPAEIAEQLTFLEQGMFAAIEPREWLAMKWKQNRAPHIHAFINQFNLVTSWVAEQVLAPTTMDKRVLVISHFIQTAKLCRRLQNFNGLIEILAGLDNMSVGRLRDTWAVLPKEYQEQFEELKTIMGIRSNFKSYRDVLRAASPPAIPHIGMALKDLVGVAEVQETVDELINVERLRMIARIIANVTSFCKPYPTLHPDRDLQDYLTFQLSSSRSEDELYERSLEIQPYGETDEAHDRESAKRKKFKKLAPTRLPSANYSLLVDASNREKRSMSADSPDITTTEKRRSWGASADPRTSTSDSDSTSSGSLAPIHSVSAIKDKKRHEKEKLSRSADLESPRDNWI